MVYTPVIYIDVFFLINFIMDYLILWTTARFGQLRASKKRIFAGAFLGGLYPLLWFLPGTSFLFTTLVVFIYSALLVIVTFAPLTPKKFLQALAYFYLVSFALGGISLGTVYMAQTGVKGGFGSIQALDSLSAQILLAAAAGAVLLGHWGVRLFYNTWRKASFRTPVTLKFGDHQIELQGLIDSGNHLVDPLSRQPVMVVEYQAVASCLPEKLQELFQTSEEPDWAQVLVGLPPEPWVSRLRLIPFSSIGKRHGLLLGIRPDGVIIGDKERSFGTRDVVMGLYKHPLCREGSYRALIPAQLIGDG